MTEEQYEHLQAGTTSLCPLVKVTAAANRGGDVLRIALHSNHVRFENELYIAVPVELSKFQSTAGTEVDNATFRTIPQAAFNRLNIKGGKWQNAEIEIIQVDFFAPEIGAITRQTGFLGESKILGHEGEIEFRGLTSLLAQETGDKTSRTCRYQLGDERCTLNIANFTFPGTVTSVTNNQKFAVSVDKPSGYFYRGQIFWSSGANLGLEMETQGNAGQLLTLFMPMLADVKFGDSFFIVAGDDKRLKTCHEKFNNAINFGGEPTIPEREKLFKYPE